MATAITVRQPPPHRAHLLCLTGLMLVTASCGSAVPAGSENAVDTSSTPTGSLSDVEGAPLGAGETGYVAESSFPRDDVPAPTLPKLTRAVDLTTTMLPTAMSTLRDELTGVAIEHPASWTVQGSRDGWVLFTYDPATVIGRGGGFASGHGKIDVQIHPGSTLEQLVAQISAEAKAVVESVPLTLESGASAYRLEVISEPAGHVPIYVVGVENAAVVLHGYGETSILHDVAKSVRLTE